MNQLEIKNLHFSYQESSEILTGIDLLLDERSTAIIGQNGAGKTTFVKLLKGLLRPTKGEIFFNGQDIGQQTVAQIAKNIGLIFQNPDDQLFKHTVLDEVMFGPLQMGLSKAQAKSEAQKGLTLLGLEGLEKTNPYDLGMSARKMVSIAAILAMDTQVVIFDEPTIAQDKAGKQRIRQVIHQLRREGKTVLSILHDMDFVAETFERAIVFSKGKVLLDGSVKEVFRQTNILKEASLEEPTTTQLSRALGHEEPFITAEALIAYEKEKRGCASPR